MILEKKYWKIATIFIKSIVRNINIKKNVTNLSHQISDR